MVGIESRRVRVLERYDPWIVAQHVGKLSVTHVESIDARGTALQQHVREATGRGADVETHSARHLDTERVERGGELLAAARHIWRALDERDHGVCGDELAGFEVGARAVAGPDAEAAGHQQPSSNVTVGGEAARDDEVVHAHPPLVLVHFADQLNTSRCGAESYRRKPTELCRSN